MSVDSRDENLRLLDHAFDQGMPPLHPPHISIPVAPGAGGVLGSTSTGSTLTHGSRSAKQKGRDKGQKKSRKMAWLLIHNTGEVQTIHMDKRQLIQVGKQQHSDMPM
jgi:hypothetical protein